MSIGNLIKNNLVKSPKTKVRIGKQYDGGYVICPDLKYDCVLGCGVSNDVSFEEELLNQIGNVSCYLFDGTIQNLPYKREEFHFVKKNIGSLETPFTTNLSKYLKEYSSIFLKMDIECGEYDWFEFISENETLLNNVSQIVLEIHDLRNKIQTSKKLINLLLKFFHIIHIHGNNGAGGYAKDPIDESIFFNVFEITFLSKRCIQNPESNYEEFPTSYDMRNTEHRQDIYLYTYPFCERTILDTKNNVMYLIAPWNNTYSDKFEFNIVTDDSGVRKWIVVSRYHPWGQNLELRVENRNTKEVRILNAGSTDQCAKLVEIDF